MEVIINCSNIIENFFRFVDLHDYENLMKCCRNFYYVGKSMSVKLLEGRSVFFYSYLSFKAIEAKYEEPIEENDVIIKCETLVKNPISINIKVYYGDILQAYVDDTIDIRYHTLGSEVLYFTEKFIGNDSIELLKRKFDNKVLSRKIEIFKENQCKDIYKEDYRDYILFKKTWEGKKDIKELYKQKEKDEDEVSKKYGALWDIMIHKNKGFEWTHSKRIHSIKKIKNTNKISNKKVEANKQTDLILFRRDHKV